MSKVIPFSKVRVRECFNCNEVIDPGDPQSFTTRVVVMSREEGSRCRDQPLCRECWMEEKSDDVELEMDALLSGSCPSNEGEQVMSTQRDTLVTALARARFELAHAKGYLELLRYAPDWKTAQASIKEALASLNSLHETDTPRID